MTTITRTAADVEIDRLFHFMVTAETAESRRLWGTRFRDAVNARNAARSAAEVDQIEQDRGLR